MMNVIQKLPRETLTFYGLKPFRRCGSAGSHACRVGTSDYGPLSVGPVPESQSVPVPVVEEFQSTVVAGGPLVAPLGVPVVPAPMPSGPLLLRAAAVPGGHLPPSPRSCPFQLSSDHGVRSVRVPVRQRSTSVDVFQPRSGKFQLPVIRGSCRRLAGPCSCRRVPGGRQRSHAPPASSCRSVGTRRCTARAVGLTLGLRDTNRVNVHPDCRGPALVL